MLNQIKPNVAPFENCVCQPWSPFKMAAVTKNRNFLKRAKCYFLNWIELKSKVFSANICNFDLLDM